MGERMIDELIEAGWYGLESDFDPQAFVHWKMKALECVECLMGPEHPYIQYFNLFVLRPASTDLLVGEGILNAMREQLAGASRSSFLREEPRRGHDLMTSGNAAA